MALTPRGILAVCRKFSHVMTLTAPSSLPGAGCTADMTWGTDRGGKVMCNLLSLKLVNAYFPY